MGATAFLTPLLSILGSLFGKTSIGDFFKKQADLQLAQLDLQRAIIVEQYKQAAELARAQMEVQKTVLEATGRRFKYFTFIMWFGPFMVGCFQPTWSKMIFDNLSQMPMWYTQSCMTIMFTVWGIQVASPVISSIFSNLQDYLSNRRADLTEMHKVNSETYKKAYYDAMRMVKGTVTPQDVAVGDKVLDTLAGNGTYKQ